METGGLAQSDLCLYLVLPSDTKSFSDDPNAQSQLKFESQNC